MGVRFFLCGFGSFDLFCLSSSRPFVVFCVLRSKVRSLLEVTSSDPIVDTIRVTWTETVIWTRTLPRPQRISLCCHQGDAKETVQIWPTGGSCGLAQSC